MLIVIEGCVGAGKSTIAKGLSDRRGSKLLLENFELNPFIRAFYRDPIQNATETEFGFLLVHFHQLKSQVDTASQSEVIADFHLGKDLIYADINLKNGRAKSLFKELYEVCLEGIPRPVLMIFLSATTNLLVERIWARRRDFELQVDPEYYAAVNAAYEKFFTEYSGQKLRVPMDEWDFIKEPALYERLASLIDEKLKTK
ncbi:MAG TPA: deoxynucleoside kinase [Terriglobales bacterium]|jgi:deoxyguanosine kinase|nr:deoxynucleoside kinase [Terriglobales bacterium]